MSCILPSARTTPTRFPEEFLYVFTVSVTVGNNMISGLLYLESSLIKGSSGGSSRCDIRVTLLIGFSVPQRDDAASPLEKDNL